MKKSKPYSIEAEVGYTDGSGGRWCTNLETQWDGTGEGLKQIRRTILEFAQQDPRVRRVTHGSFARIITMVELWGENTSN